MKQQRKGNFPPPAESGFTLVEVLLAFVVFALSFTVVLEILSGSMRNTVRAKEYTEVALIAQSVMDQVGLDIPLEDGASGSGETGDYRWQLNIGAFQGSSGDDAVRQLSALTGINLLEVELTINWGSYPREQSNTFNTVKAVVANRQGVNP